MHLFIKLMSVFKAAIVPSLGTLPVINTMINTSRNAATSFCIEIEMRIIQVGIAPWRACLAYRLQTNTDSG
ncbi:hypothetical protein BCT54_13955 [Vibrio splendidus]|uniref:Uncharacterized protein n=1 Tax=Vibrio splendidus TaxID=29497 RepID=A0A2N7JI73_VIBSP|nr:hypothetical protein BCT54_13955 [Vibrio splendidus]